MNLAFLTGCDTELDIDAKKLQELEQQLQSVYDSCVNEGINNVEKLETALNSGGNGISKSCRTALAKIDFEDVITKFNLKLNFEVPKLKNEINPFRITESPWQNITQWDSNKKHLMITSGIESVDWSKTQIKGVSSEGVSTVINDVIFTNPLANNSAISYTTDYSASMLETDIRAVSQYFSNFHQVLPENLPATVQIFSDETISKTADFLSTNNDITLALAFDETYSRGATALFDAWGLALEKLSNQDKALSLNIIATDGFENHSVNYNEAQLIEAIQQSNAFNLIIASGWSEPARLQKLVSNKGIVVFQYQIDEAQQLSLDIADSLSNIKIVTINENITLYSELHFLLNDTTKLIVKLPN